MQGQGGTHYADDYSINLIIFNIHSVHFLLGKLLNFMETKSEQLVSLLK